MVVERGKDVRARRRDLAKLNKEHLVHPDSNYCFGEGGAGTYSDGKLYTRSKKRGDVREALEWLVAHGADPEILVEAHPHIGTNRLPAVVTAMRESIERAGGQVLFGHRVSELMVDNGRHRGEGHGPASRRGGARGDSPCQGRGVGHRAQRTRHF